MEYSWEVTTTEDIDISFHDICMFYFENNNDEIKFVRENRNAAYDAFVEYFERIYDKEDNFFPPPKVINKIIDDFYEFIDNTKTITFSR